jgi:hypothetical protein
MRIPAGKKMRNGSAKKSTAPFELRVLIVINRCDALLKQKWRKTPRRADWDQSRRLYA